jgi:hypothetical protein
MGESWLTNVREPMIREKWDLMQGQERDSQGKGREVEFSWKQEGEMCSVVFQEADEQEVMLSWLAGWEIRRQRGEM